MKSKPLFLSFFYFLVCSGIVSCSTTRRNNHAEIALKELRSHFSPVKDDPQGFWRINFKSTDTEEQHKEFRELFTKITCSHYYDSLIGLDKSYITENFGRPSNAPRYIGHNGLYYFIKLTSDCGVLDLNPTDTYGGDEFSYCNFLMFEFKEGKLTSVYFDPDELGW